MGALGAIRLYGARGSERAPLKVAFFTDVHAREDAQTAGFLRQAADQINGWKADVLIGGGDTIHGGFMAEEQAMRPRWEAGRRFLDSLKGRLELIHGNHDLVGAGLGAADPYRVARDELGIPMGPRRFTVGEFTFLCLDSVQIDPGNQPSGYRGGISAGQLKWLDRELANLSPETPILLITHIPFRTLFLQTGEEPLAPLQPSHVDSNANSVLNRLAGKNLLGVLQGHLHLNEHLIVNGQSFITGGAVCGGWWNGPHRGTSRGSGRLQLGGSRPEWNYSSYR